MAGMEAKIARQRISAPRRNDGKRLSRAIHSLQYFENAPVPTHHGDAITVVSLMGQNGGVPGIFSEENIVRLLLQAIEDAAAAELAGGGRDRSGG